tara:strand:- start:604 stop:1116 length:513 start_codon:yes stop_codon:yes gene_type:complete
MSSQINQVKLCKIVINIGVGKSGEPIEQAKRIISEICDQTPVTTYAKKSYRELGVQKNSPIGVKTTLRKQIAEDTLKKLLTACDNKVSKRSFDLTGNFSFGVKEHIEIPGTKYDPQLGIWGMDVAVSLEKTGYGVKRRQIRPSTVGKRQQVSQEEAIAFAKENFGVNVEE